LAVQHSPIIIGVSILFVLVFGAFSAYWVAGFIYLYSIPSTDVQLDPRIPQFNQPLRNLLWFQLFVFLWTVELIQALFQMTVAGGVAGWYFTRQSVEGSPALRSLGRGLTKSFGSLALGSLILAIIELINLILKQLQKSNQKNKVLSCIICCVRCLFSCLQKFVQFIDKFAYISIAMYGDSFCTAAKNVTQLIERNMFTTIMVDYLGRFILFVGKILACGVCVAFTILYINFTHRSISGFTIAAVVIISFVIFTIFAYIIEVGVSTVLVCYLEDKERNDEDNLQITPELHQLLKHKHAASNVQRPTNI